MTEEVAEEEVAEEEVAEEEDASDDSDTLGQPEEETEPAEATTIEESSLVC